MSQVDGEDVLSETASEQDGLNNLRLVPVAESIRYRKRAQGAEKLNETLAEQLAQAKIEAAKAAEQLNEAQMEQKLMRRLASAGAVDLETAVLIARSRMVDGVKPDIDSVVEQLKKEKRYLFAVDSDKAGFAVSRTAGAKDRVRDGRGAIEKAAKRAAMTGNRADLQEYLKMRRDFI